MCLCGAGVPGVVGKKAVLIWNITLRKIGGTEPIALSPTMSCAFGANVPVPRDLGWRASLES